MKSDQRPLIAHVIHHLVIGGMENGVVNLINRMDAAKYRHAVLCMEDFSEFRARIADTSVPVVAMRKSTLGRSALLKRTLAVLRDWRPTIVHGRNMSGLDALLPAKLAGVPIRVHSEHGWDVDNLDGARLKPRLLRKLHAPLVSRYVTVSKDLQRYLTSSIGIAADRITQIYNGVDTVKFAPAEQKPDDVLPASFVGADKVIVGTVGRLQPVKNQVQLVEAVARLLREHPQFRTSLRLAVVGDGPAKGLLLDKIAAEHIDEYVWLPGARHDIPRTLQCLDVFALPSLNEGISNTILEAMATGLPVVASAVGGNVELVENNVTGALYSAGNGSDGLYRALLTYVASSELRRSHGAAARRRTETDFSLENMLRRYQALYDELLVGQRCAA